MTQQEREVWQRVTAKPVPPGMPDLTALLRRESEHAASYMALARQYGTPQRQQLLRLAEDARKHCHILQHLLKK